MPTRDLHYCELVEIGQRIQKRELSPVEATQAQLDRIAHLDGQLKSYAYVMASSALEQAHAAGKEIAAGKVRGPLHGVPIAVKDLCWTKDAPTAAGMTIYRDYRPSEDATVVSRLKGAGAVILGKLQLTKALTPTIIRRSTRRAIRGMRRSGRAHLRAGPASRLPRDFVTARWDPTPAARSAFRQPPTV